jgi:hypothetical protein
MSMSRPARLAAFSVLVLLLGCRSAHAAGWWDYLEALSGPGPFKGYGWFTLDVFCGGQTRDYAAGEAVGDKLDRLVPNLSALPPGILGRTRPATRGNEHDQPCLYIDITHLTSDANRRFPFPVEATFRESGFSFRLLAPLELGAGLGGLSLHTNAADDVKLDKSVFMLTPLRVKIFPLYAFRQLEGRKWPGLIQVYFRESLLVGHLDGRDFGVSEDVFAEDSEFVRSFGVRIDIGKLFRF